MIEGNDILIKDLMKKKLLLIDKKKEEDSSFFENVSSSSGDVLGRSDKMDYICRPRGGVPDLPQAPRHGPGPAEYACSGESFKRNIRPLNISPNRTVSMVPPVFFNHALWKRTIKKPPPTRKGLEAQQIYR